LEDLTSDKNCAGTDTAMTKLTGLDNKTALNGLTP
jgi:hypothetical protein